MQASTGGSGSILNMGPEDPGCSFNREAVSQSCMPDPKRRKNDGPHCALVPKDDFHEDSSGEIIKDGYRWRRYHKNKIEETPHCRSYMCTNPRCSMKVLLEEVSLFPEKLLITYVGVHSHGDLPPPHIAPEATTAYVAVSSPGLTVPGQQFPTGKQLSLQELLDFLKPVFGIFLNEPSKMEFWSHGDHADGRLMNSSLPQSSSDGGPDQASFSTNKVVQSPLHSNGFHSAQLAMQLQQENNAAFHSIDAEPEHPASIQCANHVMAVGEFVSEGKTVLDSQYIHEVMQQRQQQQEGVAEYQSTIDPLHINENVQYFGIHDSNLGAAVGDISFQSNADVLPNAETLQSLSILDPNLGAATENITLQSQSLVDSLQYNETLDSFNIHDWNVGAYEDINLMQHLLQEGQNAGDHTTFIPLPYEQPSTSLVTGGGDINSGVQHIVPPELQLPDIHQYTQDSNFMLPRAIPHPNQGEEW